MYSYFTQPYVFTVFIILQCFVYNLPSSFGQDYFRYTNCSQPFDCGGITNTVPFWGNNRARYCGQPGYELRCEDDRIELINQAQNYSVLDVDSAARRVQIVALDTQTDSCPAPSVNISFPTSYYLLDTANVTLFYDCPPIPALSGNSYPCSPDDNSTVNYAWTDQQSPWTGYAEIWQCERIVRVPILQRYADSVGSNNASSLQQVLRAGFELGYTIDSAFCESCQNSGGHCGYNSTTMRTMCFCYDGEYEGRCPTLRPIIPRSDVTVKLPIGSDVTVKLPIGSDVTVKLPIGSDVTVKLPIGSDVTVKLPIGSDVTVKLPIGVISAIGCVIFMALLFTLWKYRHSSACKILWERPNKTQRLVEDFLKSHGSLVHKRYNYYDLKKMTSSFKDKIGQGGFGEVYKGKLPDGRLIAVKLLNDDKGTGGQEFINEVASISMTSHVNIVSLLGFCFDGSKRALVYEFMANGSLEKYIYNSPLEDQSHLGWETLYQIAIGVARGLEYLHRGCNTRILHFDIKPHNILLDIDFTPKISDFGLAKLCPRKESIISMLDARGTAGYIAPEVFSRQFGGVSHKSDVYSYGMMVLEVIGKRKNVDVRANHTSEIYFPEWIYKRLEIGEDLGLDGIISAEEKDTARKMTLVALWCIQTNPMDRPAMTRVVEMLEGTHESLSIPPKPYLCSPPRSAQSPVISSSATSLLHRDSEMIYPMCMTA